MRVNHRPSFSTETSAATGDDAGDELGWLMLEPRDILPDRMAQGETGGSVSLPFLETPRDDPRPRREEAGTQTRVNTREPWTRAASKGDDSKTGQPRRRIPDRDIIDVGSRPGRLARHAWLALRNLVMSMQQGIATRAAARNGAPLRRNLMRSLLVLMVIEIAVSAGIYVSRRFTEAKVIVVPAPNNEHSVIT